jgi:hypothetical protein
VLRGLARIRSAGGVAVEEGVWVRRAHSGHYIESVWVHKPKLVGKAGYMRGWWSLETCRRPPIRLRNASLAGVGV